jgi:hypothetical protein
MSGHKHFRTPRKARIQGAYEYLEAKGISYAKNELFWHFEVSKASGYRIISAASSRMRQHDPDVPDGRGLKRKLQSEDLDKLEEMYDNEGIEAKRLPWEAAANEAGIEDDLSGRTIRRSAYTRDLYKRLAQ